MKTALIIATLLLCGCSQDSDTQPERKPDSVIVKPKAEFTNGIFVYAYVYEFEGRTYVVNPAGGVAVVGR